jgi:hypothetical protein
MADKVSPVLKGPGLHGSLSNEKGGLLAASSFSTIYFYFNNFVGVNRKASGTLFFFIVQRHTSIWVFLGA